MNKAIQHCKATRERMGFKRLKSRGKTSKTYNMHTLATVKLKQPVLHPTTQRQVGYKHRVSVVTWTFVHEMMKRMQQRTA